MHIARHFNRQPLIRASQAMALRLRAGLLSLVALTFAITAPLQANAMGVSFAATDIQSFSQISATGSPFTFKTGEFADGAGFVTLWSFMVTGTNSADIGLTGLGYDWSFFDTFSLNIANNNESTWAFSVSVSDSVGSIATSSVQSLINNGMPNTFTVDIRGLDRTAIESVFVTIMGDLPINGFDRTGEYTITTVPVPAALWLFSSALCLVGWARWRT